MLLTTSKIDPTQSPSSKKLKAELELLVLIFVLFPMNELLLCSYDISEL